ncbi:MAG: hypothetical protein K6G88_08765 [Lachnospiraceae bacterium]|nr:hypothetical protein [Lachnospiraceae bacterium]
MKMHYETPNIKLVSFDSVGRIMTDVGDGDIVDNGGLHDWSEPSSQDTDLVI